jgi:glycosyltransferase involved in cell wall biosynthesis
MKTSVILGSYHDLHLGYHASLIENPPEGIQYLKGEATHHFLIPKDALWRYPFCPYRQPHYGEFLDFASGEMIIHTSRYPAIGSRAWITDLDDFASPLLSGRFGWNPAYNELRKSGDSEFKNYLRIRARTMVAAFLHPSCKALVFWTREQIREAQAWLQSLSMKKESDILMPKMHLIYPAQKAISESETNQKWEQRDRIVLFCGRHFEIKNGAMALRIFSHLAPAYPDISFIYVGPVPEEEKVLQSPQKNVFHFDAVPRATMMNIFHRSHILFHPSRVESFGIVLLEAAASGMAIVASKGGQLKHVPEILDEDGAIFLDRDSISTRTSSDRGEKEEEIIFEENLRTLLNDQNKAKEMGMRNHTKVVNGPFSIEHRNQEFSQLYNDCLENPSDLPLTMTNLREEADLIAVSMQTKELSASWNAYKKEVGLETFNLYL